MFRQRRILGLGLVALAAIVIGVACGGDGDDDREAVSFAGQELTVITHDSFAISETIIEAFELEHDVTVTILRSGDAVEALNRAILTKGNPLGDMLFGVDNVNYIRALKEDIFEPYESPELDQVDKRWIFDDSGRITPIDYGYVLFNYEKAALATAGLQPPTRLEDLTGPDWQGRIVVQDPNTSSPGQQFMLVTIAYFGEDGSYTWLDFWRDLRANDVIISAGWDDAYFSRFSQYGGDAWLVMSYATSPPAEVIFAEEPLDESPTANLIIPEASYLQIEGVGILKGAKNPALAERFIDYMLSQSFQEDIPLNMFVYPVRDGSALPEEFGLADIPESPAEIDPDEIEKNLELWLDAWTAVVTR